MMKVKVDSSFDLAYEEDVPQGAEVELSPELIVLFIQLFGEELLEKCCDLFEGFDGPAS